MKKRLVNIKPLKFIIPLFVLIFNIMLILFPKEAVHATGQGLILWYRAALPSLFPFAVGTSLLINLNLVSFISKAAAPFSKKLFGLSPGGFFVILSGITSGYPIGIQTLAEMYSAGHISKSEAVRLSLFCSNSGPLFILGTVGTVMLADSKAALTILICHYTAPFIIGAVLGHTYPLKENTDFKSSAESKTFGEALSYSVEKGCKSMILVGGFITLFSVITEMIKLTNILSLISRPLSLLGLNPALTESFLLGTAEMTNGCKLIAGLDIPLKLPILCFLISFGGFCVHAQSVSLLQEAKLPCKPYIAGKILCGVLSFCLCIISESIKP